MTAVQEFEDELERHAIHVRHGQDTDGVVTFLNGLTQHLFSEVVIAPHGTERNHHTLRETGRTTGVVDESQLVRILVKTVVYMFLSEILRVFLSEHLIQVLTGIGKLIGPGNHDTVVGYIDDSLQMRHLRGINGCSNHITHEQQFCFTMINDIVNLFWCKYIILS